MSYATPPKAQQPLLTSYSVEANSYATSTANAAQQDDIGANLSDELSANNQIATTTTTAIEDNHLRATTCDRESITKTTSKLNQRRQRRSTYRDGENLLISSFIKDDGTLNCLSVYLLGATLLTSILNTLLLSFVVKSFQLSDLGFMNGQIAWNEQIGSTLFEPPTRLPSKSIYTNSIEAVQDKALRLERLIQWSKSTYKSDGIDEQGGAALPPSVFNLLQSFQPTRTVTTPRTGGYVNDADDDDDGRTGAESNYITATPSRLIGGSGEPLGYNKNSDETLEIGAKLLLLNLISAGDEVTAKKVSSSELEQQRQRMAANMWFDRNATTNAATVADVQQSGGDGVVVRRLLEFDGTQHSFRLPLERQLKLSSLTSNSLVVHEKLKSSELIGSLEDNLNLQTRDGNLNCKCERTMKLMSRSGELRVASFEELTLKTPSVLLSSRHLYIPKGIHYFDYPERQVEHSKSQQAGVEAGAAGRRNSLTATSSTTRTTTTTSDLRAYNLVAVNGILMASA